MLDEIEFIADVKNGQVIPPDYVIPFLDKHEQVYVRYERIKNKITAKQRRTYFGWDIPQIIQHFKNTYGEIWSKDDVHLYHIQHVMKVKFTTKKVFGKTVVVFEDVHVSKMTSLEFSRFRDLYVHHWAELGLEIKDPIDKLSEHELFRTD